MAFDVLDHDSLAAAGITFSGGNLTAQGGGASLGASGIAQAIEGKKSGKWYVEFTCVATSGNVDGCGVVSPNGAETGGFIGSDSHSSGWGYFTNGNIVNGNAGVTAVNNTTYGAGDVIGVAIDLDDSKIWFRKNTGSWIGTSGTPNPATNTNGFSLTNLLTFNKRCFPAINNSGSAAKYTANFGASAFTGAVPSGFTSGWTNTTNGTFIGSMAHNSGNGSQNTNAAPIGDKAVSKYTSTITGNITGVTACFSQGPAPSANAFFACVYADASGAPGALLGKSGYGSGDGSGYGEFNFAFSGPGVPIVSGTPYWIGFVTSGSSAAQPAIYCAAQTNGIYYSANGATYPAADNPFGSSPSTANYRYPLLASVTPRKGGSFVQVCG